MRLLRTLLALALAAAPAAAQRAAAAPANGAAHDSAAPDGAHTLFTHRDLVAGGLLAAATVALMPFDVRLADAVRDPGPQRARALRDGARVFNLLGDPGTLVASVAAFGVGRVAHAPRLADLGLHATEAIVLSGAITGAIKGVAGRRRPFLDERDADAFALGGGFRSGNRASFPSGHVTAAFATAAAVSEEARHWWPGAPWVVAPVLYAGAGVVGLARMYDDKHWASDVALGAGIGTLSGLAVVRYNHARPRNRVDRWLGVASALPSVAPARGGVVLSWRSEAP